MDKNYILDLPKANLELDFIYSLNIANIINIAIVRDIKLPSYDFYTLRNFLYRDEYIDLIFKLLKTEKDLYDQAYDLAYSCYYDGIRYFELKINPYLFDLDNLLLIKTINKALNDAQYNITIDNQASPSFEYSIIISSKLTGQTIINKFNDFSHHISKKEIKNIVENDLYLTFKDRHDLNISAFNFYDFKDKIFYFKKLLLIYSKDLVLQYNIKRIKYSFNDFKALIQDKEYYKYLLDNRILITFNIDDLLIKDSKILIHELLYDDFNMALLSDCFTKKTLSDSYLDFYRIVDIYKYKLKELIINSFIHSNLIKDYKKRIKYINTIIFYYELMQKKHNIKSVKDFNANYEI